jgi:glyoxylase I family protein
MATIDGVHHVVFTVRDAERSAQWYTALLGMKILSERDGDDVRSRLLMHPDSGLVFGLRQDLGHADGAFDEFRTGLDHISFRVPSRQDLEDWQQQLSKAGVHFTPIVETPSASVIVFRDPDNIQLEFYLPKAQ